MGQTHYSMILHVLKVLYKATEKDPPVSAQGSQGGMYPGRSPLQGFKVKIGGGSQQTGGGSGVCEGAEVGDGSRVKQSV